MTADDACRLSTGILLNILYGHHSTLSEDDELAQIADEILAILDKTLQPSPLDITPLCVYAFFCRLLDPTHAFT